MYLFTYYIFYTHARAQTYTHTRTNKRTHAHTCVENEWRRLIPMNHRTCGRAVLTNLGEMQVVTGWRAYRRRRHWTTVVGFECEMTVRARTRVNASVMELKNGLKRKITITNCTARGLINRLGRVLRKINIHWQNVTKTVSQLYYY